MADIDVIAGLKALRLYGMANGFAELIEHGGDATITSSQWLIEHLLKAESTDRAMRSVRYQMHAARLPIHRDLTHHCHIVETGNDSYHFKHSSQTAKARIKNREQAKVQAKEENAEPI